MREEPQDEEFLNNIDKGVVGSEKPRVKHSTDEGITVPYWHPDAEDHDDDAGSSFEAYA